MLEKIVLGERVVEFTLTYKKIKNINIRVKSDLTVNVSAPLKTSKKQILHFINQSENFILSALTKYENLPKKEVKLVSGEKIFYLGEQKTLLVVQGKSGVEISGEMLILSVANPEDLALKTKVLSRWLARQCERVVLELCKNAYQNFAYKIEEFPDVKFRNMRSGWGNCRPAQNRLTFAYMLVKAPLECINYVVYHEFTHFLVFNHSALFYEKLSSFLPNHTHLKNKLKQYQ